MRLRTGVDMVSIPRFARALERHGERLLARVFTPGEVALCGGQVASLAARFAAKEAVVKALGTGIGPVTWREVEVLREENGAPRLVLHGAATRRAREQGLHTWSISLRHTREMAVAFVVALGDAKG